MNSKIIQKQQISASLLDFKSDENVIVFPRQRINIIDTEKKKKVHQTHKEVYKQLQNKKPAKYNFICRRCAKRC